MGFIIVSVILALIAAAAFFVFRLTAKAARAGDDFDATRVHGWSRNIGIVAVILFVVHWLLNSFIVVQPGQVGVRTYFGSILDEVYSEGPHFNNPLVHVTMMSVQTLTFEMQGSHAAEEKSDENGSGGGAIELLTSDNLLVKLDISVPYFLTPDDAVCVYRYFTPDAYEQTLIKAPAREAIRLVGSGYTFQELSTSKREEAAARMAERLGSMSKGIAAQRGCKSGLVIQQVLIRRFTPPKQVMDAIEQKLARQQEAEGMDFVIQKETKEAERKRIEAQGIQDFQRIVSQGIDQNLLKWKGIEATEKLAASPNAKVIVMGNGDNGLPVILGGTDK